MKLYFKEFFSYRFLFHLFLFDLKKFTTANMFNVYRESYSVCKEFCQGKLDNCC
jgi:hypothetical protein